MALTFPLLAEAVHPADHSPNIAVTWDAVVGQQKIYVERDNLSTGEKKWWDGDSWENTATAITTTSATINLTTATFAVDSRYRLTIWHLETDLDLISKTTGEFYVADRPTLTVDAPSGTPVIQVPHVEWTSSGVQEAYRVWVWANSLLPGDIHDFDPDSVTYVDSGWRTGGAKEWWDNVAMAFNLSYGQALAAVVQVRNVGNNYSHFEKSTFTMTSAGAPAAPTVQTTDIGGGIIKLEIDRSGGAASTQFIVWAFPNVGDDITIGVLDSLADGTLTHYIAGLPPENYSFDVIELVEGGPELSLYANDSVTLASSPESFTIATEGGEPIAVRQASLEIAYDGQFVGAPFRLAGRNRPVIAYGAWGDFKKFDLRLCVLSREEYDAVMAILTNSQRVFVNTHHGDLYKVAVTSAISMNLIKAAPAAGEPYTTRYAWEISCEVTENGED